MDIFSSPSSESVSAVPHAVLVCFPAQGHVKPILTLAKLLHSHGRFRVTLVNTEFNHRRLLRSSPTAAAAANNTIQGFRLAAIPDGLSPIEVDEDATQNIHDICVSTRRYCPAFFRQFLSTLSPPATCVIADSGMSSSAAVAEDLGIPSWLFCANGTCGFWGYVNIKELVLRGYTPLKNDSFLTNGYLDDTKIDFVPGMEGIRLRDMPTFIRATDMDDPMLQVILKRVLDLEKDIGLIFNTFDDLEHNVLAAVRSKYSNVYTIGPLSALERRLATPSSETSVIGANLLKNDSGCLGWLDEQEQGKVVYVNFGSIAVLSAKQLEEFAWGLCAAGYPTLWTVRPDLVPSSAAVTLLTEDLTKQMEGKLKVVTWCDQEAVLAHPATGVFLTHCGWNSTVESLCEGKTTVCWPFFADQVTNCHYMCQVWGVGVEIEGEVRREKVEKLVRDVMEGEKAGEMRKRAAEWKESARRTIESGGSSYLNLEKLIIDLAEASNSSANKWRSRSSITLLLLDLLMSLPL